MNKIIRNLFLIVSIYHINAQYTLIPDQQFEQSLINQNIDSENVLDGKVLTTDINSLIELNLHGQLIGNLTGIEDFVSLESLDCSDNELQTLDISNLIFLKHLSCGKNELNNIDLHFNTELLTFISFHTQEDVGGNYFGEIDFSNNLKLENIFINYSIIGNLDLRNHSFIKTVNVQNNTLTSLDLRNGFNQNITSFDSTFNDFSCLFIDNKDASFLDDWQIDSVTNFVESEEECTALYINEIELSTIIVYPNPTKDVINIGIPNNSIKEILIYNQLGKKLGFFNKNSFNVSKFNSGIYFLKVVTLDDKILFREIIKQ